MIDTDISFGYPLNNSEMYIYIYILVKYDIYIQHTSKTLVIYIEIFVGHSLPIVIDVFMIALLWVIFMTVVVILDILVGWT